jgi:hypothetical protein
MPRPLMSAVILFWPSLDGAALDAGAADEAGALAPGAVVGVAGGLDDEAGGSFGRALDCAAPTC